MRSKADPMPACLSSTTDMSTAVPECYEIE